MHSICAAYPHRCLSMKIPASTTTSTAVERPVSFDIPDVGINAQVVHSLAKWKRLALKRYEFNVGKGLFTDMNAIRRDEEADNLHSVYVDQWDWEKVITREDRCEAISALRARHRRRGL